MTGCASRSPRWRRIRTTRRRSLDERAPRASADPRLPVGSRAWRAARHRRRQPGAPTHRPPDRRHIHGAGAQREAAARRERRLADGPAGRDRHRRHSLRAADRRRRSALRAITKRARRPPEVLARLARGEEVDASDYTFRAATEIETASRDLDWLNKGVFISVGARTPTSVIYDTYLVA